MICKRKIVPAILLLAGILAGAGICFFHRDKVNHDLVRSISPGYYRQGKGTPAEYITGQLGFMNDIVKALNILMPERLDRGDYLPGGRSVSGARDLVRAFKADADRGFAWKTPRKEVVIPCSSSWDQSLVLKGEVPLDSETAPCGDTLWQLRYDRNFLYAKVTVTDTDSHFRKERAYEADSIELFIKDDPQLDEYWELVAAPGAAPFTSRHFRPAAQGARLSQHKKFPKGLLVQSAASKDGFTAEFRFPFFALARLDRALPFDGAELELMLVRTNLDHGKYTKSAPVPLLYDGHNLFGFIRATLGKKLCKKKDFR